MFAICTLRAGNFHYMENTSKVLSWKVQREKSKGCPGQTDKKKVGTSPCLFRSPQRSAALWVEQVVYLVVGAYSLQSRRKPDNVPKYVLIKDVNHCYIKIYFTVRPKSQKLDETPPPQGSCIFPRSWEYHSLSLLSVFSRRVCIHLSLACGPCKP